MLVGREAEMALLRKALQDGKTALIVIGSAPGMGRSTLLQELRRCAEDMNWRVLPPLSKEEQAADAFSIDRDTTECDFLESISSGRPLDSKASDKTLILINNYQPSEAFERAFLQHCIPEMNLAASPLIIVAAGYPGDMASLKPCADLNIELDRLPIRATREYFNSLNQRIQARMLEEEIEEYAAAAAEDPGLMGALTRLLECDRTSYT